MTGGTPTDLQSPFAPGSPFSASIAHLFGVTLWVCAVIGLGVTAAIVYSLAKFRARPGGKDPPQIEGNRRLEVTWTLVPLGIVAALFVISIDTMAASDPP